MDRPGLAARRQELAVGIVGSEKNERVAVVHLVLARTGAEQAQLLTVVGNIRGNDLLGAQCRDETGPGKPCRFEHLVGRTIGAVTDQERHLAAGIDDGRGLHDFALGRNNGCGGCGSAGARDPVFRGEVGHLHVLHIVRKNDDRRSEPNPSGAESSVDDRLHLFGRDDGLHIHSHIGQGPLQIVLLLGKRSERRQTLLADDCDHGLIIRLGVVQAVEQVKGSRAGGRNTHADLTGKFGMGGGHQGADFLVGRPDILQPFALAFRLAQRAVEITDPVTGKSEHPGDAPLPNPLDHEITYRHHVIPLFTPGGAWTRLPYHPEIVFGVAVRGPSAGATQVSGGESGSFVQAGAGSEGTPVTLWAAMIVCLVPLRKCRSPSGRPHRVAIPVEAIIPA